MSPAPIDSIMTIDAHYLHPERAAIYLLTEGAEAAFIDNGTRFSVPHLLEALTQQGLTPEHVRYIIVTHVHLDHSGGTTELLKHCANATVIAHPRAGRHIVDPTKLVAGARALYGGDFFDRVYGEIEPVEASRVQIVEDGDTLALGNRTLSILDSPGHAPHHLSVIDSATNSIFTGDAFGLHYRQLQHGAHPFFTYVCAPPRFDPPTAKETVRRIANSGVDRVYLTHYGMTEAIEQGAENLILSLDAYDDAVNQAAATDLENEDLVRYCAERTEEITKNDLKRAGLDPNDAEVIQWSLSESATTSHGLAALAQRRRSET